MKVLPVAFFTRNRTACACACAKRLIDCLHCRGWSIEYAICDDRSEPGHVDAVYDMFVHNGVKPKVFMNDEKRYGLGASMNKGLEYAFNRSYACLRIEDDWFLKRDLDVTEWVENLDRLAIASVRMGMMFRNQAELFPFKCGLLKVKSTPNRIFTFNNQVALVSDAVYDLCGPYVENAHPNVVEKTMALRYNEVTDRCRLSPWVCWPSGWAPKSYYHDTMAFDHIGKSVCGHKYVVPKRYDSLNDPETDRQLRSRYV